jgi:hypothetical protein
VLSVHVSLLRFIRPADDAWDRSSDSPMSRRGTPDCGFAHRRADAFPRRTDPTPRLNATAGAIRPEVRQYCRPIDLLPESLLLLNVN